MKRVVYSLCLTVAWTKAAVFFPGSTAVGQPPDQLAQIEKAVPRQASAAPGAPRTLLVFTLAKGYVHSSIPVGAKALEVMGERTGAYEAVVTDDPAVFAAESLRRFDAVCLLNANGDPFTEPDLRKGVLEFVRDGKGLICIHAGVGCFESWQEFPTIIGAKYDGHPWGADDAVTIRIDDPGHPLDLGFRGAALELTEEIYQFTDKPYSRDHLRVLLSLDTAKTDMNKEGIRRNDGDFAVSWIRTYGQGRVFVCTLGHHERIYWDRRVLRHYLDGIQYALGDLTADATPSAQLSPDYPEQSRLALERAWTEEALRDLPRYVLGEDATDLRFLSECAVRAQVLQEERASLEKRLLEVLAGDATPEARQFAAKQLSLIASDASVPVLEKMLSDPELGDLARYALEQTPGPAVDEALIRALQKSTSTPVQVGIVNSLGERRVEKAVAALAPLLSSADAVLARAAITALGKIGSPDAVQALVAARSGAIGDQKPALDEAVLRAGELALSRGDTAAAAALFGELLGPDASGPVRSAAVIGIGAADPEHAPAILLELLNGDDRELQAAAATAGRALSGSSTTATLAEALVKLSPPARVLVIHALRDRGDPAALPYLVAETKHSDPAVRLAAIATLGVLGDATSVEVLAGLAASAGGDEQRAARRALAALRGEAVDRAIVEATHRAADARVRAELTAALGERFASGAAPRLLELARDPDEPVRAAAYGSLAAVASAGHVAGLIGLLASEPSDAIRPEAERALLAALSKSGDSAENARLLLAALPGAIQGIPAYCSLLRVLAKVEDPAAMQALIDAANVTNEEVKIAAIRGLAEWPSPAAAPVVLDLLRRTTAEAQRDLLLRGYLRMLEKSGESGSDGLVKDYEAALAEVASPSERKLALASLGHQRNARLLPLVSRFLDDPEAKEEAEAAYTRLQRAAFTATASHRSEEAGFAFDGDVATRWTTGEPQQPEQWFAIDLGSEVRVRGLTLDATGSDGDYPRRYEVYGASDPDRWGTALAKGEGDGPVTHIAFAAKKVRHIRIVQKGTADGQFWSIHELRLQVE